MSKKYVDGHRDIVIKSITLLGKKINSMSKDDKNLKEVTDLFHELRMDLTDYISSVDEFFPEDKS